MPLLNNTELPVNVKKAMDMCGTANMHLGTGIVTELAFRTRGTWAHMHSEAGRKKRWGLNYRQRLRQLGLD